MKFIFFSEYSIDRDTYMHYFPRFSCLLFYLIPLCIVTRVGPFPAIVKNLLPWTSSRNSSTINIRTFDCRSRINLHCQYVFHQRIEKHNNGKLNENGSSRLQLLLRNYSHVIGHAYIMVVDNVTMHSWNIVTQCIYVTMTSNLSFRKACISRKI